MTEQGVPPPDWETGRAIALDLALRESGLEPGKAGIILGHLLNSMPDFPTAEAVLAHFYAHTLKGDVFKLERHYLWDDVKALEEWVRQTHNTFFRQQPPTVEDRSALHQLFAAGRAVREAQLSGSPGDAHSAPRQST